MNIIDESYYKNKKYTDINELIFHIQEDERSRIARDLHDSSLQNLTYILHMLELLGLEIENDPIKANMELINIRKTLKNTINDIRNIIFDLRPTFTDGLGLKESFEIFFEWTRKNSDFKYYVEIDSIRASDMILMNIYRIVVECVMNAIKYSNGTKIVVKCKSDNDLIYLIISDDGIGFDVNDISNKPFRYGLHIVNERVNILGGKIDYNISKGNGVTINIEIPV